MSAFPTVRVAAIQAAPEILDAEGCVRKAEELLHEAADQGAQLAVFPDDLTVVDAAGARVGGLICWENRMPLARYAVYRQGPQIWVAPTADDSDGWLASMRHIAIESGAFVVSVPQFIPADAFPADFPVPLYDEEGILYADCDLRSGLHAKRWFDAVGHYSRDDLFAQDGVAAAEDER